MITQIPCALCIAGVKDTTCLVMLNSCKKLIRAVGTRGPMPPPTQIFDRSVYPISSRAGQVMPTKLLCTCPPSPDFWTFLRPCDFIVGWFLVAHGKDNTHGVTGTKYPHHFVQELTKPTFLSKKWIMIWNTYLLFHINYSSNKPNYTLERQRCIWLSQL